MSECEAVVRAIVLRALEECPALIPQDRRYADPGGQRLARLQATERIARELAGAGIVPMETIGPRDLAVYHAVAYTMGRMRRRLLAQLRESGRDIEAERRALEAVAVAFFNDLDARGWRLVRTHLPVAPHSSPANPYG